ncbi:TolC family outer membrane protein [Variovorax sp. PAMC 28711]|uniref:TolC family outer membrane protein n=1 Tax=Variovorax sp. PAMC 28711 TaxID=1795631 RepID=UPI000ADA445D|nr:TolC family outer membrane protein [Variovorax sp. PAMC 28711]
MFSVLKRFSRRAPVTAGVAAWLCLSLWACAVAAQTAAAPSAPAGTRTVVVQGTDSTPDGLGLVAAVRAAAQWHPSVRNAAQQVLQADEGIAQARAGYYPQVRAGIGSQLGNRNIGSYDSRRVNTATLSASQMLYDFGKVSSAVGRAEASVEATRAQVLLSVDEVARDTAQAWVDVHRQQALAVIAREQLSSVEELAGRVNERTRLGASSRSDSVQAQSRIESARAQMLNAQAQAARGRINLMLLTGRRSPGAAPVGIAGDAPPWLDTACVADASAQTPAPPPAVQLAQAQRAVAQATVRQAEAQRLPTLSLDGSVGRGIGARSQLPGETSVNTTLGLNFSAPLYEGGSGQARERAAVYALSAADAALEQAQLTARVGFEDAQAQSQGYTQRLPVLAARVESIRTTGDLYRQQYLQLGTRSLLDLLNAEQEYYAARQELIESEHERQQQALQCLLYTDRLRSAFGIDVTQGQTQ